MNKIKFIPSVWWDYKDIMWINKNSSIVENRSELLLYFTMITLRVISYPPYRQYLEPLDCCLFIILQNSLHDETFKDGNAVKLHKDQIFADND